MSRFIIQYKTFALALFFVAISMFSMSSKIDTNKFYLRTYFFSLVFNVENFIVMVQDSLNNIFVNSRNIKELQSRLENAEKRVLYYREQSFLYEQMKKENNTLRTMIGVKERFNYPVQYSKVIFRDPTLLSDYIIIDKGVQDGVQIDMPVVYSSEKSEKLILVGKIIEAADRSSKVRLVTSKSFFLGAALHDSGYTGILRGQGSWNQSLAFEFIPIEVSPKIGEAVISSGESEIYPRGLYIGEIKGIEHNVTEEFFKTLYIKPEFNYKKLSEVFVLQYVSDYQISKLTDKQYDR